MWRHPFCYIYCIKITAKLVSKKNTAKLMWMKLVYHPVRSWISARLIQPANSVFLSQKTSTSQLKPAPAPTNEHAVWTVQNKGCFSSTGTLTVKSFDLFSRNLRTRKKNGLRVGNLDVLHVPHRHQCRNQHASSCRSVVSAQLRRG